MSSLRLALRASLAKEAPAEPEVVEVCLPKRRRRRLAPLPKKQKARVFAPKTAPTSSPSSYEAFSPLLSLPTELLAKVESLLDAACTSVFGCCGSRAAAAMASLGGSSEPRLHHGDWLSASSTRLESTEPSRRQEAQLWTHEHNFRCEACGVGGEMLLCDFCNVVYHLGCLVPALGTAPSGVWRCPACAADVSAPLIGAVAATLSKAGDLLVAGGYDYATFRAFEDAYSAELQGSKANWRRLPTASDALEAVEGEGVYSSRAGDFAASGRLHAFDRHFGDLQSSKFENLHTLEVGEQSSWVRWELGGEVPGPRADFAVCALSETRVVVFGGFSVAKRKRLEDLFVLDLATRRWIDRSPEQEEPTRRQRQRRDRPSPRAGHSLVRVGAELWLFGGLGLAPSAIDPTLGLQAYLNDVWSLRMMTSDTSEVPDWRFEACSGTAPCGRSAHSSLALGPHVVVFGGANSARFLGDLTVLHTPTRSWSTPVLRGDLPTPRMRAAMIPGLESTTKPHFLIFGGTRLWRGLPTDTSTHDGDLFAIRLLL